MRTELHRLMAAESDTDLLFLHENRFVRAWAIGETITHVQAVVENLTGRAIEITIQPGTYFVASGNHQNMVTRRQYSFNLSPSATETLSIDAACMNAELPIPGGSDRFTGVKSADHRLKRFLEASQHVNPMVVQAGVWVITDNYNRHMIQKRLVTSLWEGRSAVSDADINEAAEILDSLGIRHRLSAGRRCSKCGEPFPRHTVNCANNPQSSA